MYGVGSSNVIRGAHILLFRKRQAIGALVHAGIAFMSADSDTPKGAIILSFAMVSALGDGAFNASVGFVVHNMTSFSSYNTSMPRNAKDMCKKKAEPTNGSTFFFRIEIP
jgi:hypothetical protein